MLLEHQVVQLFQHAFIDDLLVIIQEVHPAIQKLEQYQQMYFQQIGIQYMGHLNQSLLQFLQQQFKFQMHQFSVSYIYHQLQNQNANQQFHLQNIQHIVVLLQHRLVQVDHFLQILIIMQDEKKHFKYHLYHHNPQFLIFDLLIHI